MKLTLRRKPKARRSFGGKKSGKRKRMPRRKNPPKVQRVVSDEVIAAIQKAFYDWLWKEFVARKLPVGDVAAEIGVTRQGLEKVLRRKSKAFQFATFVRGLFVRPAGEMCLAIAADAWKIELRWAITRGNGSYLSNGSARA